MLIRKAALAGALVFHAMPALAFDAEYHPSAKPRPLTAFDLGPRQVQIVAVTRRVRADTPIRQAHLEECRDMAKVFPGYPQPALVSFDLKVNF